MTDPFSVDPVRLLADLIGCASVTPDAAGVFDVLERALTPLGFAVTRLSFEGDGSYPVDNLFATRAGNAPDGRHLLFAGHTDVVPPGARELWTHDPFRAEIADGKIYGRGAADMKSAIAAFVAALAEADPAAGTISLALTNDEEADAINGTEKLMAWAAHEGHRFDFAIVGEPSAKVRVGDSIKIGRRGSFNGKIVVSGTQGHVAYPDHATNPLPVAATLISALSGQFDDGTAHFPPSNFEFTSVDVGNNATNVIPARAELRFNVRYNDRWTPETLRAATAEAIETIDAEGTTIELSTIGRPSRAFLTPASDMVTLLGDVIARATGTRPELSTAGGTSDARFVAQYCPVVEFGLAGPTMHQADEHVAIADIAALGALYAQFITAFFAAKT